MVAWVNENRQEENELCVCPRNSRWKREGDNGKAYNLLVGISSSPVHACDEAQVPCSMGDAAASLMWRVPSVLTLIRGPVANTRKCDVSCVGTRGPKRTVAVSENCCKIDSNMVCRATK